MEIVRVLMPVFLSIIDEVLENVSGKTNFEEFQRRLAEKLREVGRETTRLVLEELDQQIRQDKKRRKGWQVHRRNESKEILTQFGMVRYERTYYKNKKTNEHAYLVDETAGYTPHQRVDTQVKAQLVAGAANVSYRKSAEQTGTACGARLSGQTVMKAVREFERPAVPEQERKRIDTLYIEADEDHVASQRGQRIEARLVYIHEGWAGDKRRKIKKPFYLSSVDEDTDTFWERVWEEVDARYDIDKIKAIYIMGDGAGWIQRARSVFPQAEFILDRFHLKKQIKQAAGWEQEQERKLWEALRLNNLEKVQEAIDKTKDKASKSRKQALQTTWKYISNQWEAIQKQNEHQEIKCSAEGHVSHVLSARLSSRPMGWSVEGARHMAYVRTCQANGSAVTEEYIRQARNKSLPVVTIAKETIEKQRRHLQETRETLGNIPILKWSKTYLYETLKGLAGARG